MSQVNDYSIPGSPLTMAQLQVISQNISAALGSNNLGSSAPANPFDGMNWIDTSGAPVWSVNVYSDGNGWREMATINVSTGALGLPGYLKQTSSSDFTSERLLLTDSVGSQPEHNAPSSVPRLARLDRLSNADWIGPGHSVLLDRRPITANAGAIDFTSFVDNSRYENYDIIFSRLKMNTSGSFLRCRFSANKGETFDDSAVYRWSYGGLALRFGAPTLTPVGAIGDNEIELAPNVDRNLNGALRFSTNGDGFGTIEGALVFYSGGDANYFRASVAGINVSLSAPNAIRFFPSSGTFSGVGFISIYGRRFA